MMKTAVYCGFGWADNIGNGFVDFGLQYQVRTACPDITLHGISNTCAYLKNRYTRRFPYSMFSSQGGASSFDLRTLIDADYIILGGSLLCKYWMNFNRSLLDYLISTKIKVVLLGASGGNVYDRRETDAVRGVLKDLNLHALISRDEPTYERYRDLAATAHNGIDNAFFLPEAFRPMRLRQKDYTVVTFDIDPEPKDLPIKDGEQVIRTLHSSSWLGRDAYLLKRPLDMLRMAGRRHLISDHPDDYLHVYANAARTFSDRVHACVATLDYGGEARLFTGFHRAYLFERVGLSAVNERLVRLEPNSLKTDKEEQLEAIRGVFA